jgi:alkanesulfonate monooxygenase SsuD/methylene tetrahydromethanopterin reductase-like flavin-dependent oxidoreductase (luciferase family)
MDYVFCYLSYYGYKMAQNVMKGFWEEMARLGKDRNPYRAGFAQVIGVAESRQQALDLYTEPAEYFYGRCLHVDARFASPPGYVTEATQRVGLESQVKMAAEGKSGGSTQQSSAQKMQQLARDMKGIVDAGYVVIGSPDEVVEQLTELAKTLNVGQLMLLMQFGNMSKDLTKYNTRLFAEKVMPKLRPLFSEWENRWWPKPMEKTERAALPAFTPRVAAAE